MEYKAYISQENDSHYQDQGSDTVRGGSEVDMFELISHLRLAWTKEEVMMDTMTKGSLNIMWYCRLVDDLKREDALKIRIHGEKFNGLGCDDSDLFGMQLVHRFGFFPPLYACFNNGCIYKFANDRNITYNDLMDPDVIENLSRHLQRIHTAGGHKTGLTYRREEEVSFDFKPKSFMEFSNVIHIIPECEDPNEHQS